MLPLGSQLSCKGFLELKVIRDGKVVRVVRKRNLIVNTGLALLAYLAIGSGTAPTHIAIGTDGTAPAAGDTALNSEIDRQPATKSRVTTSVTNDTAQYVASFSFSGSYTIREAGLFNAAAGGDMLARQTFSVSVISGDTLQVTWKIQFS